MVRLPIRLQNRDLLERFHLGRSGMTVRLRELTGRASGLVNINPISQLIKEIAYAEKEGVKEKLKKELPGISATS